MRILIIKTSSLGDVVHALPVIDYIHQSVPGAEIEWVVEEAFLPVVENNPRLTEVHVVRTKKWRKALFASGTRRDVAALYRALRDRRFDLVIDIQGNLKSGLIAWLTGAPKIIGLSKESLQEKINAFFTTQQIPFRSCDVHVSDRYLRIVSVPFGRDFREMELKTDIVSSPQDQSVAERYISSLPPDGLIFFFQVGTTWRTKLWHQEGWCELARRILKRYPGSTILVNWGSQEEKELGEAVIREVGDSVRLLPWFTIRELIPVIKMSDLVVGGDTGPVYLAAAVGTPTVSYYRATDAVTYAPRGENNRYVQASMSCAGCGTTSCDRDDACRRSILVDSLFTAVVELLP